MAFVTNYTYKKLCSTLNIKDEITMDLFLQHIYNNPKVFYFFNKLEIRYLFNVKNILQNENEYGVKHFQKIPAKQDTYSYVFENLGKLSFHLYSDCELLKKDFINFNIPQEIKELGSDSVSAYREWFKENNFKTRFENGEIDQTAIIFRYNSYFPNRFGISKLNENYELIRLFDNSGTIESEESFDINNFNESISHLIKTRENMLQCEVHRKLANLDFLSNKNESVIRKSINEHFSENFMTNFGYENLLLFWKKYRALKFELMQLLLQYFKWTYKYENKDFDKASLEDFGLKCCSKCKERSILEKNKIYSNSTNPAQ
ncbi:hypothetical protein [Flavobacterium gawalongense]|uniref:Uncharacterized protein n=1 Tax=Flavobacterium gawalongense TaxID=2594432 RepID=A0A553BDE4_9FLAO|nr:hypothetical protein [Flavobacterium gawalongense]TRX01348.1 hypothetical protein FNW33_09550 [Flavobacterium gawalongense]TRX05872.1 hypothetical protein FNW12_09635 [Flavobacterium gawalongense]TRX06258.1 hypothetical protein FNW11_14795 [Flavobacterium gawalongense]TRX07002.1 hypothetical protein FNW10_15155 [Flavobacterium gawalongense]TRX23109.1 hypothetical protein FNW38_15165 [Flavobacterium gawalongense]